MRARLIPIILLTLPIALGACSEDSSTGGGTDGGTGSGSGAGAGSGAANTGGSDTGGAGGGSGGTDMGEAGGSAGSNMGGAAGGPGYASTDVKAAITRQITPLDLTDPFDIRLVTLSHYPYLLTSPMVTVPPGFTDVTIEENMGGRSCPNVTDGCRQDWVLHLVADTACRLNGDYDFDFSVTCAPDGDCSMVDPSFTTYSVTATLQSENFCSPP